MNWMPFALFTILLYGLHDVLLKTFANSTNKLLASFIINSSAAVAMFIVLVVGALKNKEVVAKPTINQIIGLVVAGIALGFATVTFMQSFNSTKGNFSVVLPFVYVGIIMLSALVGKLIFAETISNTQWLGIALSIAGIILISKN